MASVAPDTGRQCIPPRGDGPRCATFLQRKQRYCRMRPIPPSPFCYAHDPGATDKGGRSPCTHCSALVAHMARHLKVCPAAARHRALVAAPYHRPGINLASPPSAEWTDRGDDAEPAAPGPDAVPEPARALATDLHHEHASSFAPLYLPETAAAEPPEVEALRRWYDDVRNSVVRYEATHFRQNAAIAGLVLSPALGPDAQSMSSAAPVIVELGAGRAFTSLLLAQVLAARGQTPAAVVVVDTASPRRPADSELRSMERAGGPTFLRIRCDLLDLDISGIDAVREAAGDVYFVGKHVCGSALDMSLKAVARFAEERERAGAAGSVRFVLASCCRHRCDWSKTVSAAGVWEGWGVGGGGFSQLMKMASWGAGGTECAEDVATGRKVMELVDAARALWLRQERRCQARLVRYVDVDTSPENTAIVGCWGR